MAVKKIRPKNKIKLDVASTPEYNPNNYSNYSRPTEAPVVTENFRPRRKRPLIVVLWRAKYLILVLIAILGLAFWLFGGGEAKEDVTKQATADLVKNIGQLIILPTGEEPVTADISDVAKLKAQSSFYSNAQNGDQLLVYPKSGRAFIYSPSAKKLVNVGQVEVSQ